MATMLKPSSIEVDQPYNYLKRELEKIKFAEQSFFNQLKKLLLCLALFLQEKFDNTKDFSDKEKLASNIRALSSIKGDNLINLSKIDEIKFMILNLVDQHKAAGENSRKKLKIKKINNVNSEKNEAIELKEHVEMHKEAKEMIDMLHEITAARPAEHTMKLQESYALLKMEPRASDESEDDFQDRLLQHTTKAISTAPDTEGDGTRFGYDCACEYLSKYSASPVIDRPDVPNEINLEKENISSMKMSNRK